MRKKFLVSVLLFVAVTFSYSSILVSFNQKNLSYMGRVETVRNQYVKFYWPGTSVTINFKGTEIKAILKNGYEETYFYVIVDGKENEARKTQGYK